MADVLGKRISDLANNSSLAGAAVFPHTQGSATMKVALSDIADFILAMVDQSKVDAAVSSWLDQHPEATTTVEDGAVTTPKLADGAVTSDKIAVGTILPDDISTDFLDGICIRNTASGSVAHFADGGKSLPLRDALISVTPIQSGSGDPSPTNIRPITGWTGATVTRTGKNLLEPKVFTSGTGLTNPVKVDFSKYPSYTFSCNISTNILNAMIFGYSSKSDALRNVNRIARTFGSEQNVRTISRDSFVSEIAGDVNLIEYIVVYFYGNNTTAQDLNNGEIQVEIGSSATAFEPYNGASYSVTWTEAGTVYGGHFDPITGILTAEYEIINIDGSKTVNMASAGKFYYSLGAYAVAPNARGVASTGWCSHYKLVTDIDSPAFSALDNVTSYNNLALSQTNGRAFFNDSRFSTADDFKDYLIAQNSAGTPVQYVYKLATPSQYQLSPIAMYLLDGVNNIGANCGGTEVEYYANPKSYIADRETATRSMIAGIEASYVATKNYSSGDLLIVEDTLYITTAAIASGAALTPGTNMDATTVAANLGGSLPSAQGVSF